MCLPVFQEVLSKLIASPMLCLKAMREKEKFFNSYDLTSVEKKRLLTVLHQKGMSVNCTLYRINRITPVYTMLPHSCSLLGDEFFPYVQTFWNECRHSDLQFKNEVLEFFMFLQARPGVSLIPYLQDTLLLEGLLVFAKYYNSYTPSDLFKLIKWKERIRYENNECRILIKSGIRGLVDFLQNGRTGKVPYAPAWHKIENLVAI